MNRYLGYLSFDKIAQIISTGKSRNLQSTLNKSRDNADLQPLHNKDNPSSINGPKDLSTQSVVKTDQISLSHMKDNRIAAIPKFKKFR
jgi:hypothetical protein